MPGSDKRSRWDCSGCAGGLWGRVESVDSPMTLTLRMRPLFATRFLTLTVLAVVSAASLAQTNAPGSQAPAAPALPALSPATGLTLLDVLKASLEKNPQLKIQQYNIDIQAGVLKTAVGQFDWTIGATGTQQRSYTPLTAATVAAEGLPPGVETDTLIANNTAGNLTATKEFRNGITLTPSVQTTRTTDNFDYTNGVNEAQVGLQIVLPLLRNSGKNTVDAQEISARQQLEATRLDLSQLISDTLATAATRYWTFVAADATLAVYKASEARGNELLNSTQTLVEADRLPANELNQARANLASRTASRNAAELSLLQARQQLVLVMGLGADKILSLPAPAQDIPNAVSGLETSLVDGYIRLASTRRADVLAARLRADANGVLEGAAHNQLKPQLDVSGSIGYTGLQEGTNIVDFPHSLAGSPRGPDFTIGVTYSQTPANNAARGRLESATALSRQSQVTLSETARNAATNAVVAFEGVRSTLVQLQQARDAVRFYQAALNGEREKYRLGTNSLVDVLTIEDRLTSVVVTEVNARLAYAIALVQLRQATGMIVPATQDVQQVDPGLFGKLPEVDPVTRP